MSAMRICSAGDTPLLDAVMAAIWVMIVARADAAPTTLRLCSMSRMLRVHNSRKRSLSGRPRSAAANVNLVRNSPL
eukprot:6165822-Prymnesium_polylepis.3